MATRRAHGAAAGNAQILPVEGETHTTHRSPLALTHTFGAHPPPASADYQAFAMSMFGLPPKEWRGITVGVPRLRFPLEEYAGQTSFPSLRNGVRRVPDGISPYATTVAVDDPLPQLPATARPAGSLHPQEYQYAGSATARPDPPQMSVQFAPPPSETARGDHPERPPRPPSARYRAPVGHRADSPKKSPKQPQSARASAPSTAPPPSAAPSAEAGSTQAKRSQSARGPRMALAPAAAPVVAPAAAPAAAPASAPASEAPGASSSAASATTAAEDDQASSVADALRKASLSFGVHVVQLLEPNAPLESELLLGTWGRVMAVMISAGLCLILLSWLYLYLITTPGFVYLVSEWPAVTVLLAVASIIGTYQIALFVPYLLGEAIKWQEQNGWRFEKLGDYLEEDDLEKVEAGRAAKITEEIEKNKAKVEEQQDMDRRRLLERMTQAVVQPREGATVVEEETEDDGPADLFAMLRRVDGRKLTARQIFVLCKEFALADFKVLGFTAPELEVAGIQATPGGLKACSLREMDYATVDLCMAGFSAVELKALGYKALELKDAGYPTLDLKQAGFSLAQLRSAKCAAAELRDRKITPKELAKAGFPAAELLAAGSSPAQLKELGFTATQMRDAGMDAAALRKAGYTVDAMIKVTRKLPPANEKKVAFESEEADGDAPAPEAPVVVTSTQQWSVEELRVAGYSAAQMCEAASYHPFFLQEAGYELDELRDAGFSAAALREAGFAVDEFHASATSRAFAPVDLATSGFSGGELVTGGFTLKELRKSGLKAKQLRALGFAAVDLRGAGSSARELRQAGYPCAELLKACSLKELRDCAVGAQELHLAGATAKDLMVTGYTAKECYTGGIAALKLKNGGYTLAEMKDGGYTVKDLKAVGYRGDELRAAGFTCAGLKEGGFTPKELKAVGFYAMELSQAGFGYDMLLDAGFTAAVLRSSGTATATRVESAKQPEQDDEAMPSLQKQSSWANQ